LFLAGVRDGFDDWPGDETLKQARIVAVTAERQAGIPESFFELRQTFAEPCVEHWKIPSPFILPLHRELRTLGVEINDFSFNKDAANVGDLHLNVTIRKMNAAVRIGLDTVTYIAANPSWDKATELVTLFDKLSELLSRLIGSIPASQKSTLALHVSPGSADFEVKTRQLIASDLGSGSIFCGISVHRPDSALIIDKSLKYDGAAFIRLERIFGGDTAIAEIAAATYEDELKALRLLGIPAIP